MADEAVKAFAAKLAAETDEAARARLLAQAKMLASQEAPKEAFEAPIRTLAEYLAAPIEVPPVLIEPNVIVRGGLHATIGRAGKGKTVMNLNRILRWAAGNPMFEGWKDGEDNALLAPQGPLRILVIENEGAAGMFHKQIGMMLNAEEFMSEDDRKLAGENVLIWGEGGYSDLKLDDQRKADFVRAGVEQCKPDIVFLEPFRSLWSGEENSATDMNTVVDVLVGIASEYECAALIAHHERKGGNEDADNQEKMSLARGSSVLEGIVTTMENFESVKGGEYRELAWSKMRHGVPPNPVRMEWVRDAWWYKWVPESKLGESIIFALRQNGDEPMSISDLHDELDEPKQKLRDKCRELVDAGRIKKMPSLAGPGGSSGTRYRVPTDEAETHGGLAV